MKIEFFKYHGLGNDYVLFDETKKETGLARNPQAIQKICARAFGVGSDGILFVLESKVADIRMRMFNPDGSESEMCGNGIRCLAKYAYDYKIAKKQKMSIETLAGIKDIEIEEENGKAHLFTVNMGTAKFEQNSTEKISIKGREFEFTSVSMGNPHAVIFTQDPAMLEHSFVKEYGPLIEKHPRFPKKTNVEFAFPLSKTQAKKVVWERGAGITLACGTGTCATAAAGVRQKKFQANAWITFHLDGGDLQIKVSNEYEILMKGPAEEVFKGTISVD